MRTLERDRRRIRHGLLLLLGNLVVLGVLITVLEGAASLVLTFSSWRAAGDYAERSYTEHDPELGWVSQPGVDRPNAFGPGVGVRTNHQRFRADHEIRPELPPGRLRLVAAGDSFTFGYGVANDQVWVEMLARREPWLETVNLAQGGYGLDQAFLRYRRDGELVRHDVAVLAFISNDFRRMELDRFIGYDKPFLAAEGDRLVVRNVPVPEASAVRRFWLRRALALRDLRLFELLRRGFGGQPGGAPRRPPDTELHRRLDQPRASEMRQIVTLLVRDFAALARQRQALPVLVFLPTSADAERIRAEVADWRPTIATAAAAGEVAFLDLIGELRRQPEALRDRYFIHAETAPDLPGHYTADGNEWVAAEVGGRLVRMAALRERAALRGVELGQRPGSGAGRWVDGAAPRVLAGGPAGTDRAPPDGARPQRPGRPRSRAPA